MDSGTILVDSGGDITSLCSTEVECLQQIHSTVAFSANVLYFGLVIVGASVMVMLFLNLFDR